MGQIMQLEQVVEERIESLELDVDRLGIDCPTATYQTLYINYAILKRTIDCLHTERDTLRKMRDLNYIMSKEYYQ